MSIPPFPSQDLAKLVLGYLAEEQLMTAYDEFLQASPYLDALRNEYDRIFMTSLKSILSEYRAVKIYVDTCKPFVLRKKVFQCHNLLEVVKFLVANVDIKKIQQQEATEKASLEKQSISNTTKTNTCELCHSLSLSNCVCKHRADVQKPEVYTSYAEANSLQNSVETTPLADLPGNHVTTRKKHMKVVDKEGILINSKVSSLQNSNVSNKQSFSSNLSPEEYLARCENSPVTKNTDSALSLNSTVKATDPLKSNQNIEEFNNVLKSVVNRNKTLSGSECSSNQRISNAGTFQDFATGVTGGESHSATYSVPDSSTSENSNIRPPLRKDVYNDNAKGPPQCHLMLQVVNDAIEIQTCQTAKLPKLLPKSIESQIKILSDVKVDNKLSEKIKVGKKKPLVPINATSTPLMQMQTIMINGTPAYKHTSNTHTFTKDEIMAMPTLIVVPASGSSQVPTSVHGNPIMTPNSVTSEASTSPRILGPLIIDVPPNTAVSNKPTIEALPDLSEPKLITSDLVKTVENITGTTASVPKDNVTSLETNTPQVLPPKRKSSSTPRRTSHIRVLDFTTPRRILHETINEQVPSQSSSPPVEVPSGTQNTESASIPETETIDIKSEIIVVVNEEVNNDTGSTKENEAANKSKQSKKYDWDADLRALVANEKPVHVSHRKPKPKSSKKKKSSDKIAASKESESKKKIRNKRSPRVKKSSRNVEEIDDDPPPDTKHTDKACVAPCKPTIKIICGDKMPELQESQTDNASNKNKSHEKIDECVDTPETERLSLQNVIGAKLNISDFLETPYKQALYDIQMETPKFLGPDLPDEPLSDIKIMNIPTPRFLNTPKPAQATPSSYSSRPTDYSSGGSYYKPDDQDYMPIPDLTCPVTSSKEDLSIEKSTEKDDEKKSRPVRKCAKNVSYYSTSGAVKKDVDDNIDAISSCSDTVSVNSSLEFRNQKETKILKTPRAKPHSTSRKDGRKKTSACKKRKSPKDSMVKDKTKSFMKMKPKYTPKKGTPSKNGKKMHSPHSRGYPSVPHRKRTNSKDRLANAASTIVPSATKSRRKSSTPRKLHCTKTFDSEDCDHNPPDDISNIKPNVSLEKTNSNTLDSDTDQIALRWSDEGSEDGKSKDVPAKPLAKETEDITQIQQFIVSTGVDKCGRINDGTLQRDLMKRGFDLETAKIIERDLLDDTPPGTKVTNSRSLPISVELVETIKDDLALDKTAETSTSVANELKIVQDESDDEIELSVHECNEESNNYFVFKHDDTKEISQQPPIKIKNNFTMEICIEDVTMTLKAVPFKLILDQDPLTVDEIDYSYKETVQAVNSISDMDKLYTPLKDSIKSQCYEIFDSTLTSIDTPLKAPSPPKNACDVSVTELVLEKGKTEPKDNTDAKKRKRARSSSNDSANSSKRTKPDADLLLKAANIQNIDIETVLTKLHGH